MSEENLIKLKTTSILSIPFQNYANDFTFIVNGKEFQTSRLISELISPKICQQHSIDPTIDTYTINTQNKGDFSPFLQLINFNNFIITENDFEFIAEVIEQLGNESIEIEIGNKNAKITKENAIKLLLKHSKYPSFFSKNISNEIDFISSNFYEISKSEEMKTLSQSIIDQIISNPLLQLEDEDQLLTLVNDLYKNDRENCELYKHINFSNVSVSKIQEFLSIFDIFDMNHKIWNSISKRLQHEIPIDEIELKRYIKKKLTFKKKENIEFNGIIRYLLKKSNGDIKKEIDITSSSLDDEQHSQYCAISFDDPNKYFASKNNPNQWICFDFKEHRVSPTCYTIRSYGNGSYHPRNWIVEGSEDGKEFKTIDSQQNCSHLNGYYIVHTFNIDNQHNNKLRYIRLTQNGLNWFNNNYMRINSFELYGDFF